MPRFRIGSVCLSVLLLTSSLRSCDCESEKGEASENSGRQSHKLRRTLRTQHPKVGSASHNGTDVLEAEPQDFKPAAETASGYTDTQHKGNTHLHEAISSALTSDPPSSVFRNGKLAPDLPGQSSDSSDQQLRIPKILHQLYFVSNKSKDYETGTVVDKQFPKKWQASCKAAFPDWEYK